MRPKDSSSSRRREDLDRSREWAVRGVGSRDMLAGFGANSVWASISTVMSTIQLGTCGCTRLFFPGSNTMPAVSLWAWSTVLEESRLFVAAPS